MVNLYAVIVHFNEHAAWYFSPNFAGNKKATRNIFGGLHVWFEVNPPSVI